MTYAPWNTNDYRNQVHHVVIDKDVQSIYSGAFKGCEELAAVEINSGYIKAISSNAFDSCTSLSSITIPDSVESIDTSAFSSCASLRSVTSCKYADRGRFCIQVLHRNANSRYSQRTGVNRVRGTL